MLQTKLTLTFRAPETGWTQIEEFCPLRKLSVSAASLKNVIFGRKDAVFPGAFDKRPNSQIRHAWPKFTTIVDLRVVSLSRLSSPFTQKSKTWFLPSVDQKPGRSRSKSFTRSPSERQPSRSGFTNTLSFQYDTNFEDRSPFGELAGRSVKKHKTTERSTKIFVIVGQKSCS